MPLMAGVRTDFDRLLVAFCAKESLRFRVFADIFRQMEFSTIFSGRRSEAELKEVKFIDNLFIFYF